MASFLDYILELASRPGNAIRSGVVHGPDAVLPGLAGDVHTSGTELPGINQLPDQGLSIGPLNLTPRTVGGFAGSALLDPLTYLGISRARRPGGPSGMSPLSLEEYRGPELNRQGGVTSEHWRPGLGQDLQSGPLAIESRTPETGGAVDPRARPIELVREATDYPIQGGQPGPSPMSAEEALRTYSIGRGPQEDVVPGRGRLGAESQGMSNLEWDAMYGRDFTPDGNTPVGRGVSLQGQAAIEPERPGPLNPEVQGAARRYNQTFKDATTPLYDEQGQQYFDQMDQANVRNHRNDLVDAYSRSGITQPVREPGRYTESGTNTGWSTGEQQVSRNPYSQGDVQSERVRNALYSSTPAGKGQSFPPIIDRMRAGKFNDYVAAPPKDLFIDGELNPAHEAFALKSAEAFLQRNMKDFPGSVANSVDAKGRQVERFRQEGLMRRSPGPDTGSHSTPMLSPDERQQSAGSGAMRTVSQAVEGGDPAHYGNELPTQPSRVTGYDKGGQPMYEQLANENQRQNFYSQDEAVRSERARPGYAGDSGQNLADAPPVTPTHKLQFATESDAVRYRDAYEQVRRNNEMLPQLYSAMGSGDRTAEQWARRLQSENESLQKEMGALARGDSRFKPMGEVSDVPDYSTMPEASSASQMIDNEGNTVRVVGSQAEGLMHDPAALAQMQAQNLQRVNGLINQTSKQLEKTKGGKFQQRAVQKAKG